MATTDILAIRYSEALFNAAASNKMHDGIESDFEKIKSIIADMKGNSKLLLSQVVPKGIKASLWEKILKANKFNEITNNFIRLLLRNNRLYCLPSIFKHFHYSLLEKRGILVANVTTAVQLEKKEIESITKDLKELFEKPVLVEAKVKKQIIGGIIVRVGSKMINCSISSKLQKIKQVMQAARI